MKHPLAQEWKAGPPVALSFDQYQLVDEPLGHSVRIALAESGEHSLFISLKSPGKALHLDNTTLSHLILPLFQAMPLSLAHDLPKRLDE